MYILFHAYQYYFHTQISFPVLNDVIKLGLLGGL